MSSDAATTPSANSTPPNRSSKALKLGTFAGIDVFVHWTFAILIGWIVLVHLNAGHTLAQAFESVVFVLTLFLCVLLHEFGHALAARRYGIGTRDITLLPIGGVATLERMPEKPAQELVVALAGPAVNVVIATVILGGLVVAGAQVDLRFERVLAGSFWERVMLVNMLLATFNLLPAFPMDGGRVLRALLAASIGRRRATRIAAGVGQGIAVVMGVAGIFSFAHNPFLVVLAVFVFLGAQSEARMVEMDTALDGLEVRAAMMTRFRTLQTEDSLGVAVEALLAGSQHDFPVLDDGSPVGILRRNDLVQALARGSRETPVAEAMCRDLVTVEASAPLKESVARMHSLPCGTMAVMADGRLAGLLTFENVSELIVIRNALGREN